MYLPTYLEKKDEGETRWPEFGMIWALRCCCHCPEMLKSYRELSGTHSAKQRNKTTSNCRLRDIIGTLCSPVRGQQHAIQRS